MESSYRTPNYRTWQKPRLNSLSPLLPAHCLGWPTPAHLRPVALLTQSSGRSKRLLTFQDEVVAKKRKGEEEPINQHPHHARV
jgi:hypothetical protein